MYRKMADIIFSEPFLAPLNEGWAYEEGGGRYGNTGGNGITGITFFNGRVLKRFNVAK